MTQGLRHSWPSSGRVIDDPSSSLRAKGGDGGFDVVALDRLAGEGFHGDAHGHSVLGGGLDLISHGLQRLGYLLGGERGGDPFLDEGHLLGTEGGLAGFRLFQHGAHFLDGVGVGDFVAGGQGELGDPVAEDAGAKSVAGFHGVFELGPHFLDDGHDETRGWGLVAS